MVSLLKNDTCGFYLIESTTDDWITDHAGDPGECDLAVLTEGTHYMFIKYVRQPLYQIQTSWFDWFIAEGEADDTTTGEDKETLTVVGEINETTLDNLEAAILKIKTFVKRHNRRTSNAIYFVNMYEADDYVQYPDEDFAAKDYARIHVLSANITRNPTGDIFKANVTMKLKIVWT